MSTQEFPAAEPVSASQMSDADEVGARVARDDIAAEPADSAYESGSTPYRYVQVAPGHDAGLAIVSAVAEPRTATFKPPSLVGRLPQATYDACIIDAAVRLNGVLDGLEIDAPGEVGDALNRLRNAVVNARRA